MERDTHRREEGWGAVPGTVFAMLFTVGVLALGELGGSFGDHDRQFVSHYSDGSKRALDIAGGVLLAGSGLSFLVVVARLRDRLRMAATGATLAELALAGTTNLAQVGRVAPHFALLREGEGPPGARPPPQSVLQHAGDAVAVTVADITELLERAVFHASKASRTTSRFPLRHRLLRRPQGAPARLSPRALSGSGRIEA